MVKRTNKNVVMFLLVIAVLAVSASASVCGNGFLESGEECDDGNQVEGDGCSNDCRTQEVLKWNQAVFDLEITKNLLFTKTINLEHVVKDQLFQAEFKAIEQELVEAYESPPGGVSCDVLPASFSLRNEHYVYGKLDETDEMLQYLAVILSDPIKRSEYGITDAQYQKFLNFLSAAESAISSGQLTLAAKDKCCSYNALRVPQLKGFCEEPPERPRPGGGSSGNFGACGTINYVEGYLSTGVTCTNIPIHLGPDQYCEMRAGPGTVCARTDTLRAGTRCECILPPQRPTPVVTPPTVSKPVIPSKEVKKTPILAGSGCGPCGFGEVCDEALGKCALKEVEKPVEWPASVVSKPKKFDVARIKVPLIIFSLALLALLLLLLRGPRERKKEVKIENVDDMQKDINKISKEIDELLKKSK